jgi:hypothetical protein
MFTAHRTLLHRAPAASASRSEQRRQPNVVQINGGETRQQASHATAVCPAHGRHCICSRCSMLRAA